MDESQRQDLIRFARDTLDARLAGRALPAPPGIGVPRDAFGGAFVTLKNQSRLRGCIGRFHPDSGLVETVQDMALAVLDDPRFRQTPVTLAELPVLSIEISILSPMERTEDPAALQVGVHGIYIRGRTGSGCFLPQVAPEQGWSAEQFLSQCCSGKAGLPADAWRDPETEVFLFTAEVFGDAH